MLFDGWFQIFRTLILGVLAYLGLVVMLRVSGKRTLAKMNAFDLVVTVALGSTLATIVLSKDTSLLQGFTAFFVLVGMQFVAAWGAVHSSTVNKILKSEPVILLYRGRLIRDNLHSERVKPEEVYQAIRANGAQRVEDVGAVVLETDGTFSVLTGDASKLTALQGVSGRPDASTL